MFDMGKFSGTKELIQADLTAMSSPIISRQTDVVVPALGVGRGWIGTATGREGSSRFLLVPAPVASALLKTEAPVLVCMWGSLGRSPRTGGSLWHREGSHVLHRVSGEQA